jgi:hypothetical protein
MQALEPLLLTSIKLVTRAFLLGSDSQQAVSCETESEKGARTASLLGCSVIKLETI